MRVESSVTSLSWIPSEAVTGPTKATFEMGLTHYDEPPPDVLTDLKALRDQDAFRFANQLHAVAEFDGDTLVSHSQSGGIIMGATTVRIAKLGATFQAISLPDLHPAVEQGPGWVRFRQTCGGRTALPLPRPVPRPPFVKLQAPTVWTTISLTLHSDGSSEFALQGASAFPRHWIYGPDSRLALKAGLTDYKTWLADSFGPRTPWGLLDSPALVTAVESALERELSVFIMNQADELEINSYGEGDVLARQGEPGNTLFLLLDGVVSVKVDDAVICELGPGAVFGERAILEGGHRTSTLIAMTKIRVASVQADAVDRARLMQLAKGHHLESEE